MSLSTTLKILKAKSALNESKPLSDKTKNARRQANEAKAVLHKHKSRNPEHHKKFVIKNE